MKEYMPEFENEAAYEAWMNKQSKKIPRDENGMATFENMEHFMSVLGDLGMSDVQKVNDSLITGLFRF